MSAKKYLLRANEFGYNDEYYNLYDNGVGVCAAYNDFDSAMAAWKKLEIQALKNMNLSNTQSFFEMPEAGLLELDAFVHQHTGKRIFDDEYPDFLHEGCEEDIIQMTAEQVFEFLTIADHFSFKLIEFAADEKLYVLWIPEKNNYLCSPKYSSEKPYLICVSKPQELVDQYLMEMAYGASKLFETQGTLKQLSYSPSLLKAIVDNEENLNYDEATQTLSLTKYDGKALMAIQPLLTKPLFEIREVSIEQINDIQQGVEQEHKLLQEKRREEWLQQSKPEPPDICYASGELVQEGDAVLYGGGLFPAQVMSFFYSGIKASMIALKAGDGPGQPTIDRRNVEKQLVLVERNTTDYVRSCLDWLRKYAEAGNAHAQFALGNLHVISLHVPRDDAKAVALWQRAAEQNHPIALEQLGNRYGYGGGVPVDPAKGAELLRRSAEQGYAPAQYGLGFSYLKGNGVQQDIQQAGLWFRKAAEQGNAHAQAVLGLLYYQGEGVPLDYQEAIVWYQKAANQGNADAQFRLAWCYQNGHGVEQNYKEAVRWYQLASSQDHWPAVCNLADKYEHGLGVAQDYQKALEPYKKAANMNVLAAMYSLGSMYKEGRGVTKSEMKALKWLKAAAKHGYIDAFTSMETLQVGDFAMARKMLANPESYNKEGFYQQALNVYEPDLPSWLDLAFKLHLLAANTGHYEAQFQLGFMCYKGFGTPQDLKAAAMWYQKSAEQGYDEAQIKLAKLYEKGEGLPQDKNKALHWYRKAAKQKHPDAMEKIAALPWWQRW